VKVDKEIWQQQQQQQQQQQEEQEAICLFILNILDIITYNF